MTSFGPAFILSATNYVYVLSKLEVGGRGTNFMFWCVKLLDVQMILDEINRRQLFCRDSKIL